MISLKKLLGFMLPALAIGVAVSSVTAITLRPAEDSEASSHREAPLISADPLADTTDVYAFIAPDAPDMVTFVGNWIPMEEPAGGPNFFNFGDDVWYEFSVDYDGDTKEDISYAFRFYTEIQDPTTFLYATGPITSLGDENFNIRQFYDVQRRDGKGRYTTVATRLAVPPNNVGPTSTPNYDDLAADAIYPLPGGGQVFAGQRDDPFFADLGALFDLATIRSLPGNNGGGLDALSGFNVNSIVFQVPIASVTECRCNPTVEQGADGSGVIGVWSDTYRGRVKIIKKDGTQDSVGKFRQVSRLGNPLVNEVVIPLSDKDRFNASDPEDDGSFLPFVLNSDLAEKLNIVYNGIVTPIPETGRQDLVTIFLTGIPGVNQPPDVKPSEQLRLNTAIKPSACANDNRLGVIGGDNCGFPNGRGLNDDVVDIALRAVACGYGFDLAPCVDSAPNNQLGDGVDANDKPFLTSFPYVSSPHSGFDHEHEHGTGVMAVSLAAGLGGSALTLVLLAVGAVAVGRIRMRRTVTQDEV